MFCAEGTVLSVLSGLNPRLSEEEVKEEMMRCFSPMPTFSMTLQPIIQDKLLKKIDGDRPPRSLREAHHQALDLERKNQITKRYEMTVQVSQISDCALGEDIKKVVQWSYVQETTQRESSMEMTEIKETLVLWEEDALAEEVEMTTKAKGRTMKAILEEI